MEVITLNPCRKISMEIEILRSGQPRPYADSEYEYELTVDGMFAHEVKSYCMYVLCACNQDYETWLAGQSSAATYFAGYYKFSKTGENKYHYYVLKPFCD